MQFSKVKLQMIKDSPTAFSFDTIHNADDAVEIVNSIEKLELSPNKKLIEIGLDIKNNLIMYTEVITGAVTEMLVPIDSIFKPLLLANCTKFILMHNNPSGNSKPSKTDINTTKKIQEAGKLMNIELLDYIIIANENDHTSILKEIEEDA